jgi:hypothetical protein
MVHTEAQTLAVFNNSLSRFFPASLLPPAPFNNAKDFLSSPSFFLASSRTDGSAFCSLSSLNKAVCLVSSWVIESAEDIEKDLSAAGKR